MKGVFWLRMSFIYNSWDFNPIISCRLDKSRHTSRKLTRFWGYGGIRHGDGKGRVSRRGYYIKMIGC
jgi:hypothetical protein